MGKGSISKSTLQVETEGLRILIIAGKMSQYLWI